MVHRVKVIDSDLNSEMIVRVIEDAFDDLDLDCCRQIVIMPALESSHKSEQSGVIVRTEIVEGIVSFIRKRYGNSNIIVVCSSTEAESVFNNFGYIDLAKKYDNLKLLDVNSCEKVKVLLHKSKILGPIELPQELVLADAFIVVGTLRRHIHERLAAIWMSPFSILMSMSLRLKAQSNLGKVLFDLNSMIWPSLCIIDARYVLEETGPIEGTPKRLGKILVGTHPVATDIAAAKLVSESTNRVPYLKYAMKQLNIKDSDVHIDGEYQPIKLSFITDNQFRLWRLGLFARRISNKIENLGNLVLFFSLALISVGMKDLATGRWVSFKDSLSFASNVYSKIYEMETLLDRKIVINRHVKEQSIS